MNRINIINSPKYKGSLIQFFCTECNNGGESFIEFNNIPKVKPGNCNCNHFDIKFLFSTEKNSMKLTCSFNCKLCKNNDMLELFNEKTKNESGFINYKCKFCKNGSLAVEYLFLAEEINLNDMPPMQPNIPSQNNPNIIKTEQKKIVEEKKITLIFEHDGKKYEIKIPEKTTIPGAFHELCLDKNNKKLVDLEIKNYYKKGSQNPLTKYKSIKDLNLKDKDIITFELMNKRGWN